MRFLNRNSLMALALVATGACTIEGSTSTGSTKDPYQPPESPAPYIPTLPPAGDRKVVILHTNDEHSHLFGYGPVNEYPFLPANDGSVNPTAMVGKVGQDQQTVGGIARRQYLINKARAESTDPVLLLSAGDSTMGTVFHMAENKAAPDFLAMALLGYDFMTLGNHEFDFGPDFLAQGLGTVDQMLFGGGVPVLASNIHFDDVTSQSGGALLKGMYGAGNSGSPIMPWATKTLANGLKVGFFGLMGYEAAMVSAGKGPISFSVPTNGPACSATTACGAGEGSCVRGHCVKPLDAQGHVLAMAAEAQAVVDVLRNEQKVDLVIALTHLGSVEDGASAANPGLAQLVSGIDVIIGGHSHQEIAPVELSAKGGGKTIMTQAGNYGRLLGKLVISVSPKGVVSLVAPESEMKAVDYHLDSQIVSSGLEQAVKLTAVALGPVIGGINDLLFPLLQVRVLDPVVHSGHDIIGDVPFKDTNLINLVTDANRWAVGGGACLASKGVPVVAVQANGVIRDTLRFGTSAHGGMATVADIFGVVPLGASPYAAASAQAPGFPMVQFYMRPVDVFVAANIGVTQGLQSDSFFLSYAGMRVSYDATLAPFDQATFNPTGTESYGRITKMELDMGGTYVQVYSYDKNANPQVPWAARWAQSLNPLTGKISIVSNLYLAGFLAAYGFSPRDETLTPVTVRETVLCQVPSVTMPDCTSNPQVPSIAHCATLPGAATSPWPYLEVKEWAALLKFLTAPAIVGGLESNIPTDRYSGSEPLNPRVVKVTP